MSFKITAKWLFDNRTERGGWTSAQLRALDIPTFYSNWTEDVIGMEISLSAKEHFEHAKNIYARSTLKKLRKKIEKKKKKPKWLKRFEESGYSLDGE